MDGLNDTADNLLVAIERDEAEISPSTLYAVAAAHEGVPFVNGSPQVGGVPAGADGSGGGGADLFKILTAALACRAGTGAGEQGQGMEGRGSRRRGLEGGRQAERAE